MVALIESLIIGVRALTVSANESLGEEGSRSSTKGQMGVTLFVALAIAVGLFFLAPLGLTRLFKAELGTGIVFWLVEGLIRVTIFIVYIAAMTRIPDLRRVFEYHGAEHMAIHALEHGEPLTPEACRKYRTLHLRCGTSFLLVVMVVSILVFALVRYPAWYWLVLSRIVLIPLIAGVSYEIIKFAGRHEDSAGGARAHGAGAGAAVDDHAPAGRAAARGGHQRLWRRSSSWSRRTARPSRAWRSWRSRRRPASAALTASRCVGAASLLPAIRRARPRNVDAAPPPT